VIQEVYRSGAIRLRGDIKGKPNVVNGQCLKHYIAGEKFVGHVEELNLRDPEDEIPTESSLPETPKSI
jgi:hypothetical protein